MTTWVCCTHSHVAHEIRELPEVVIYYCVFRWSNSKLLAFWFSLRAVSLNLNAHSFFLSRLYQCTFLGGEVTPEFCRGTTLLSRWLQWHCNSPWRSATKLIVGLFFCCWKMLKLTVGLQDKINSNFLRITTCSAAFSRPVNFVDYFLSNLLSYCQYLHPGHLTLNIQTACPLYCRHPPTVLQVSQSIRTISLY
jgi:hypothetical protein